MSSPLQISTGLQGHDLLLQPSYWLMDAEGNFGRGATPQAALESYLGVAAPEIQAFFTETGLTFTVYLTIREVPLAPSEGQEAFASAPNEDPL